MMGKIRRKRRIVLRLTSVLFCLVSLSACGDRLKEDKSGSVDLENSVIADAKETKAASSVSVKGKKFKSSGEGREQIYTFKNDGSGSIVDAEKGIGAPTNYAQSNEYLVISRFDYDKKNCVVFSYTFDGQMLTLKGDEKKQL